MKKIDAALAMIDEQYIAEAETAPRRHRARRFVPIAAALAALLALGGAAVGIYRFAPGLGIVAENDVRVLTGGAGQILGGVELETVVLTDSDGVGTLSVWVWREEEVRQDPSQAMQGIAPKELEDFHLYIDGIEYRSGTASMSNGGWSRYSFYNLPISEEIELESGSERIMVELTEADGGLTTRYKYDGGRFELLPIADGLVAAQLYDDDLLELAKLGTDGASLHAHFKISHADGSEGSLSGVVHLSGDVGYRDDALRLGRETRKKAIEGYELMNLNASFDYQSDSEARKLTVPLPAKGETLELDEIMLDAGGVKVTLTSVTYGERGLEFAYEVDSERFSVYSVDFKASVFGDVKLMSGIEKPDAYKPVYMLDGKLHTVDYAEDSDLPLEPGDEIVVWLRSISMNYSDNVKN